MILYYHQVRRIWIVGGLEIGKERAQIYLWEHGERKLGWEVDFVFILYIWNIFEYWTFLDFATW